MKKRILLTIVLAGACGIAARAETSDVQFRCEAPWACKTPGAGSDRQSETSNSETPNSETTQAGTAELVLAGLTLVGMSGLRRKKVAL